jgi:hypothetical protein
MAYGKNFLVGKEQEFKPAERIQPTIKEKKERMVFYEDETFNCVDGRSSDADHQRDNPSDFIGAGPVFPKDPEL